MVYKGYDIRLDSGTTMYTVHTVGKGPLPKVLQGLFTTKQVSMLHIDRYLESKEQDKG